MSGVEITEFGAYGGELRPRSLTIDLGEYDVSEVRVECGRHFVATTTEHLIECLAWLLTNVDTDTLVTKDRIEVDG